MLFVKRKNCGQNLEYRQRPQVEGGNQDRQMLVKTEVLQFKERSFETFFYKYLSQSDTCQIESQKMKGACTKLKENNNGTVLANKLNSLCFCCAVYGINDQIEETYKDLPKAIFIGTEYSAHRFTKKKLFERIRSDVQWMKIQPINLIAYFWVLAIQRSGTEITAWGRG